MRIEKTKKMLITKERTKEREREREREPLKVSPQALDQSKSEPLKGANNWSSELSISFKARQFHFLQIHHIKHNGTNFKC